MNELELAEKIALLLKQQPLVINIESQIEVLNFVAFSLKEELKRQTPEF